MSKERLKGRHVLVVEDEYYLATDLARALRDSGAEVAGPVGTLGEASAIITSGDRIDAAILALDLRDEKSLPVADLLEERGIPFMFATGYDREAIPPRLRRVAHCTKPYDPERLVGQVVELGA